MMLARDGTRLDADLYRPQASGPHPCSLMPSLLGPDRLDHVLCPSELVRGKDISCHPTCAVAAASEGKIRLFEDDLADGKDTVDWARRCGRERCRRHVGFSLPRTNQLLAAAGAPGGAEGDPPE